MTVDCDTGETSVWRCPNCKGLSVPVGEKCPTCGSDYESVLAEDIALLRASAAKSAKQAE